jgi:putative inorganic carbon (hco3(-)) transporter
MAVRLPDPAYDSLGRFREPTHQPAFAAAGIAAIAAAAGALAILAAFRPGLAALLLAGAVVVVACVRRVEIGLLILIAAGPVEGALQPAESALSITKGAGALCFLSFALHAIVVNRRLHFDRMHAFALGLVGLSLLSSVLARDVPLALSTSVRYASYVALFVVVTQLAGSDAVRRWIAWVLSGAAAVAGAMAVTNLVSGDTALATLRHSDPNDFAFMLATALPLTLWLLRGRRALRLPLIVLAGVISAAIVLSFSRSALLGLAAAAVWHIVTDRRQVRLLLAVLGVTGLALFAFIQLNPSHVEEGFELKRNWASENVDSRLELWGAALELTERHPLLGVGPGNFRHYYFETTGRPPGTFQLEVVHNAYLDVAVELGVLGAVLLIAFLFTALTRAERSARAGVGERGFATAVRASLIVSVVASLTLTEQYFQPMWLFGGLATVLWWEARRKAAEDSLAPAAAPRTDAPPAPPSPAR